MFLSHSQAIYDFLKEHRLVEPAQLDELNEEHKATGKPLADVVVDLGLLEKDALLRRIAEHLGYDYVSELPVHFPGEAIASLNGKLARDYGVMPMRADDQSIDLLVTDPFNAQAVDDLTFALGRNVRLYFGDPDKVEVQIKQHYGEDEGTIDDLLQEIGTGKVAAAAGAGELSERDIESMSEQTPIIKFVNLVIGQAIRDKASDIHFEPFEHEFKIRYRIDGALYEMAPPPKQLALPIISRVKVLASLNIAERRVPQDGRIKINIGGRAVDLRVSTLPTQFGESVVLRVLDQSAVRLDISQLGMPEDVFNGSIMQVPVAPLVGLTFASALRSFLRQDPDVIMVGEIRDLETAQISIQASLTGHLVLSTLHTNDSAGAVTRLVDMGVEAFLIASSLEAVLAQRLVRRVCTQCKATYMPGDEVLAQVRISRDSIGGQPFHYGRGCPACSQSGYKGRMGIYEWLRMSEQLRDLVARKAPTLVIRDKAIEQGMRTLRDDGLRAILDGKTSVEEVIKYT
ncbi:MAG: Flp pilus assembly complex ATPase component TadA [Opitutaceae bacterium]|nr:Flp pilus assembly complex ATPase component TadA [Opitutaceae bacterium]